MNILLCCAAGMSTSLLVTRMIEAAKDLGVEAKIWAVGEAEVMDHLGEADVLLLGPQIRYKLKAFREAGAQMGIPVDVIKPTDYGMINGKNVVQFAVDLKNGGVIQ